MHVIRDLVHILTSQARYSGAQWNNFLKILTQKELEAVEMVKSEKAIPRHFSSTQRHKLVAKLCRQVSYYAPPASRCSEYQEKRLLCESYVYTFRVLTILKRFDSAIELSAKILALCNAVNLTLPRIEVLKFLVRHYLPAGGKEYYKYSEMLQNYHYVFSAESKAENCYNSLMLLPQDSKNNKARLYDKATQYQYLLQSFIDKGITSNEFHLSYFKIQLLAANMKGDFEEGISCIQKAMAYFSAQPLVFSKAMIVLRTELISIYLQTSQLDKARVVLSEIKESEIDSTDYVKCQRLLIRLNLMQQQYERAYKVFKSLLHSPQYSNLLPVDAHIETITAQYFNVLILMGFLPAEQPPSRIMINRFLKKEPGVNYLKKEIRIQLIIVQLLFNIYYREYDDMEVRLDTLKDYCARRLSVKSPFLRSNIFIRMLLVIPICRFNSIRSRRHGLKLYKRLINDSTSDLRKDDRSLEIIPYERLWDLVLEHLSHPKNTSVGVTHMRQLS